MVGGGGITQLEVVVGGGEVSRGGGRRRGARDERGIGKGERKRRRWGG